MSEELHDAMNKARIQQSLPDEYMKAILNRFESKTPQTDALVKPFQGTKLYQDMVDHARQLESERDALQARVTSQKCLLDQRWEMMRELEEVCGTKDVAKAVEYVKGLKARVKRLEEALEFGVGLNRAKELMSDNHIVGVTELVKRTKEVPCPNCYGGHFKPCNICGDSGVALLVIEQKESKP